MKIIVRIAILFATIFLVLLSGYAVSEEMGDTEKTVTITGVFNDDFQIITGSKKVFEIGDTAEGDDVAKLVGKKVKVTGEVGTYEETKFIMIESYEVVE